MPPTRTGSGLELALAVWHRRKWIILPVFLILLAAAVGLVRTLPAVYEATATVLVGHQQDPDRANDASAISELETRLRTISEQILSRSSLSDLVTRFQLYPDERPRATGDELVARLRRDVRLDFKEVRDQFAWRTATITVSISYRSRDPESVAAVTNALAALFIRENDRIRGQYAAGTTEFLRVQFEEARRNLQDIEGRSAGQRTRDYDAAVHRYLSLLERYDAARLAQLMEARLRDGQLRLLDPAAPSQEPVAPRRTMLLLMGLMLSAGAAAGAALLAEARDTSFHSVDALRTFTGIPVLVTIPPIVAGRDLRRRAVRVAAGVVAVALVASAAGVASSRLAHGNEGLVRVLTPDRF